MTSSLYNQSVTTSWVALPSARAHKVSILNNTGADLLVADTQLTGDSTRVITLEDSQSISLQLQQSGAEVSIKAAAGADGVQIVFELM